MSIKRTFARDVLLITILLIVAIPFYLGRPQIQENLRLAKVDARNHLYDHWCENGLRLLNEKYAHLREHRKRPSSSTTSGVINQESIETENNVGSLTKEDRDSVSSCRGYLGRSVLFFDSSEPITDALDRIEREVDTRLLAVETQRYKWNLNNLILIIALGLYPLILVIRAYKWLIVTARGD